MMYVQPAAGERALGSVGHDREAAVDWDEALRRMGGGDELLLEIAQIYLDDIPVRIGELEGAVRSGDAEKIRRAAHAIKGSVSNFGAQRATKAAFVIEDLARQGNAGEAAAQVSRLLRLLDQVREELSFRVGGSDDARAVSASGG